jgi:hypothetical protein
MTFEETIKIASAVLLSIGSGGIIVFALSSWLGKVWANRIMDKERAAFERELAELKSKLEKENSQSVEKLKTDLEIFRDTHLRGLSDRLEAYRHAIDIISDLCTDVHNVGTNHELGNKVVTEFNRGRLKAFGYLSILAPQDVMNAYVVLTDYLFAVATGGAKYDWIEIRRLTYILVNAIRMDIGIADKELVLGKDFSLPS